MVEEQHPNNIRKRYSADCSKGALCSVCYALAAYVCMPSVSMCILPAGYIYCNSTNSNLYSPDNGARLNAVIVCTFDSYLAIPIMLSTSHVC